MPKIKVLPEKVASRIAAGEVVERPASVVKELIENSIDAGSSIIKLEIEKGGKTLIGVSDNGSGLDPEDMKLTGERHATSKIVFFEDIENLSTLGFRGEALASIGAVSQFKLTSTLQGETLGTELDIQGGEKKSFKRIGFPPGTTVEVRNLFYNVPVRKKFLKAESTELNHIHKIFIREALAYPEIAFFLYQDKKELIKAPKTADYLQRIEQLLGKDLAAELIPLEFQNPIVRISGFIAKPTYSRGDRHYQLFYLNQRWITSPFLSHAVERGYHGFLEPRRFPVTIIFLALPSAEVDINIHPTKREVRFKNERIIYDLLVETVQKTLKAAKPIPQMFIQKEEVPFPEKAASEFSFEEKPGVRKEEIKEAIHKYLTKEEFAPSLVPPETYPAGNCLQIRQSYILYFDEEGLFIIDQHAAHERVLFDQLQAQQRVSVQSLLIPVKMEVSAEEITLLKNFEASLKNLGFEIEHFGGQSFVIRTIPAIFKGVDPKPLVYDILDELRKISPAASFPDEKIYALIACHSAVRQGNRLGQEEMWALIKDWKESKQPFNCPHGRPTAIKLTWKELEKKFKRH